VVNPPDPAGFRAHRFRPFWTGRRYFGNGALGRGHNEPVSGNLSSATDSQLIAQVQRLLDSGSLLVQETELDEATFAQLGFDVAGGVVRVPADVEALSEVKIRQALSRKASAWLVELTVHPVIASTNTALMDRAQRESVAGVVKLAELQVQGRGRRGRRWLSPFARNLALSMGVWVPQPPAELGGFSLLIGLAVLDLLRSHGIAELELKWPNDVLLDGKKLAGTLVELVPRDRGTELVVGLGLNMQLSDAVRLDIDQPVTDLRQAAVQVGRNELIAGLLSSIVDYVEGFGQTGFAPMRTTFDENHRFHGRACRVLQGTLENHGVVLGVTPRGELLLDTAQGPQAFSAGEVSLRAGDA